MCPVVNIQNGSSPGASAPAITDTFTSNGTWHSPVGGVVGGIALVECWGGGGGGQTSDGITLGGNAGGGGGYAFVNTISITPDTDYDVVVGAVATKDMDGHQSYFVDPSTVAAEGGGRGRTSASGGTGGGPVAGSGFTGGDGGAVGVAAAGGGGGGGAGNSSNGTIGSDANVNSGGTGGAGGSGDGGMGGNGAYQVGAIAQNGSTTGGGGGGGSLLQVNGGTGARGEVRITYTPA